MAIDLTRRRLLQGAGAGAVAGLAGCSGDITEGEVRAEAVSVQPDELDAPVEGTVEATVLVANLGIAADLEVTVEAVNLDSDSDEPQDAIVNTASAVESFESDEQRKVQLEIEPGPQADGLLARVSAAD